MKKFNLFNEIIVVDKKSLLAAINSQKEFGLTTKGEIVYPPFSDENAYIFKGQVGIEPTNALMPSKPKTINELLGKDYRVVEDDDRVLIKAASAWQSIIGLNNAHCLYNDTTADGIDEFSDKVMEDMGWQATEFSISYRDMVDEIESKCEGTLLCIEQEEPYQFSGLGFVDNIVQAQEVLFNFCQKRIATLIETNPDYAKESLTDEEQEAAEFFKVL